jgi:hypothetical protein
MIAKCCSIGGMDNLDGVDQIWRVGMESYGDIDRSFVFLRSVSVETVSMCGVPSLEAPSMCVDISLTRSWCC